MASLIHKDSCETVKEKLDLFSVPPTKTSLEKGNYVEHHPVSILTSTGPIEFVIPGESNSCINLSNTLLYVRERFKNKMEHF